MQRNANTNANDLVEVRQAEREAHACMRRRASRRRRYRSSAATRTEETPAAEHRGAPCRARARAGSRSPAAQARDNEGRTVSSSKAGTCRRALHLSRGADDAVGERYDRDHLQQEDGEVREVVGVEFVRELAAEDAMEEGEDGGIKRVPVAVDDRSPLVRAM